MNYKNQESSNLSKKELKAYNESQIPTEISNASTYVIIVALILMILFFLA